MAILLKWILMLGLLVAGTFFLLTGVGVPLPLIKYKGLVSQNVPAGVVLLAAGITLSRFWKITVTEETTETTSTSKAGTTKTTTTTKTTHSMKGPLD
jgi:type III secretory pathway component EscR